MKKNVRKFLTILLNVAIFMVILSQFRAIGVFADAPLTIDAIRIETNEDTVVISWSTNADSLGKVEYATDSYFKNHKDDDVPYNSYVQESGRKTTYHVVRLIGLDADTKYHYRLSAESSSQQVTTFDRTFETDDFDDNTVPIISNVHVPYVGARSVTIQWDTNEAATSRVEYGTTINYNKSTGSSTRTKVHDITIKNLQPNTLYHFRVVSSDKDKNTAVYADEVFKTDFNTTLDDRDLEIFDIRPTNINDSYISSNTVTLSWRTTRPATGRVRYGTTPKLGKSIVLPEPRPFLHIVTLKDLEPATTYYYTLESKGVLGKTAKSEVSAFTTRGSENEIVETSNEVFIFDDPLVLGDEFSDNSNQSGLQFGGTVSNLELEKRNIIFYSSFDTGLSATYAQGSTVARNIGDVSVTNSGIAGGALDLTKAGGVQFQGSQNFNSQSGTIAFWFKSGAESKKQAFTIFDAKNKDKFFNITFDKNGTVRFRFENDHDGDHSLKLGPFSGLFDDTWKFVAITWDYKDRTASMYYRDENGFIWEDSKSIKHGAPDLTEEFFIGSKKPSSSANMVIDEFAIFDRLLAKNEIEGLIQNGLRFSVVETNPTANGFGNDSSGVGGGNSGQNVNTDNSQVLGVSRSPYTETSALYRVKGKPAVYAILNGQKHYISNPTSFDIYGYRWEDVKEVTQEFLDTFPYARLITTPDNSSVYYLYQRPQVRWLKIAIPSPTVFISYPQNEWGNIVVVNQLDVDAYPFANLVKVPKQEQIYLLENSIRRPFASSDVFAQSNLNPYHIVGINEVHLNAYNLGSPVTEPIQ